MMTLQCTRFKRALTLESVSCTTTTHYFSSDYTPGLIINLWHPRYERWPKRSPVRLTCCPSFVVYNAAAHGMLSRCDDAIVYCVSFWCVSPNVSYHEWYFSIKPDANIYSVYAFLKPIRNKGTGVNKRTDLIFFFLTVPPLRPEKDCNNFSLHGVIMFWTLVPFTSLFFVNNQL